jgi:hypothetical protein
MNPRLMHQLKPLQFDLVAVETQNTTLISINPTPNKDVHKNIGLEDRITEEVQYLITNPKAIRIPIKPSAAMKIPKTLAPGAKDQITGNVISIVEPSHVTASKAATIAV